MNTLVEKAPAKINLTLDVLHKREDGYHEVEMIMTSIDLADRIILTPLTTSDIKIECQASFIPVDQRNLVYQAAKLLKDTYHITSGIKIVIEKRIPVAAGLAGGSSDAAAALRGLNRLWGLNLSLDQLAELGSKIGSDVSFCVYGGTALAKGRGEIIEKLSPLPRFWVVLAKPPIGVSTGNIYTKLNLQTINSRPNTQAMLQAIEAGSFKSICQNLGNVLENVTLNEHPEVERLKQRMVKCGAEGVLMSGSGPTVYAITQKESRVQRVYNALKGFCKEVYVVRSIG